MTNEALTGVAAQCANFAKTDMRNKRKFDAVIATYNDGHGLYRMRKLEKTIRELAGEDWLNSGPAKELTFEVLRTALSVKPQQCIAFVSVVNNFAPTAKFDALPTAEEKLRIAKTGNIWERVEAGYFKPHDALVVTVQTAERVCLYKQRLMGSLLIGEPEVMFVDQSAFGGRLKMFGVEEAYLGNV